MLQKLGHHLQLYSIVTTAVTIMIGWAIISKAYDILLAVPIASTALTLRYLWEQACIIMLGDYLRLIECELIPSLIGKPHQAQHKHEHFWVGWEHYFCEYSTKSAFYKPAVVILMVLVPFLPCLVYSRSILASHYLGASVQIQSNLPLAVHACVFILYSIIGIYLWQKLTRT